MFISSYCSIPDESCLTEEKTPKVETPTKKHLDPGEHIMLAGEKGKPSHLIMSTTTNR